MSTDSATTAVEISVDPACPWAWLTWNWLQQVSSVRPVAVTTRLFSLAEVNRGAEVDERRRESHERAEQALRVLAQARREHGDGAMARLYREVGESYHERSETLGDRATLEACARAAGLDAALVERGLSDRATQDEVLADHRAARERGAFGVPSLSLDGGRAVFGPVVDRRLGPDEAAELWDHTAWLLRNGSFFELKAERTTRPDVGRYRALEKAATA